MDVEKLMQAVDVLNEVTEAFGRIREDREEDRRECALASLQCSIVKIYLLDLVKHLQDGMDPYDACLTTARGETLLSDSGVRESQLTLFKLLWSQGHKE